MLDSFYLIVRKESRAASFHKSLALLQASARERGVKVCQVYVNDFDFSAAVNGGEHDAIYRLCDDKKSVLVEKYLMNSKVKSFYQNYTDCIRELDNVIEATLMLRQQKLPIVKTIFGLSGDKKKLKTYVDYLGGFPIIIKATGGSHGIGVMRVDSFASLCSVADYLSRQAEQFILRQYIDYTAHARLIVLGDKVVSSIEYKKVPGDFRSNVGTKLSIIPQKFGSEVEAVAIKSVLALGYKFGGVDILIDKNKKSYITEVNFPCYFPRAQDATGVDIAGLMIDFLIKTKA